MKIIFSKIVPFKGFDAMNIFGVLIVRKNVTLTSELILHEKIHSKQMKELLYIFFYVFYFFEWILKFLKYGKKSYRNISFEREAYTNDKNADYLKQRKRYAFLNYL